MANIKVQARDKGGEKADSKLNAFRTKKDAAGAGGGRADYKTATPGWLMSAIIAVTDAGGAIQFGYSRDGGVYTVVILMNGDIEKNYVKQSEGIDAFCEQLYTAFTEDNGQQ